LRVRVDEMNSVSCHGKAGVSDTFAAAIWALSSLFSLAELGAGGVNFHIFQPGKSSGYYDPIVSIWNGHTYRTDVRPLYYALLLFRTVLGSRLVPVQPTSPDAGINSYAAVGHDRVRVFVLNRDLHRSQRVSIRLICSCGPTELTFLRASSLDAMNGVILGSNRSLP